MSDETVTSFQEGHAACPFVAFEDDRDHRADHPDYGHRCFAAAEPEPRALPHQERFCLSAAFAQCPIFLDWARQEAAAVEIQAAVLVERGFRHVEGACAPIDDFAVLTCLPNYRPAAGADAEVDAECQVFLKFQGFRPLSPYLS